MKPVAGIAICTIAVVALAQNKSDKGEMTAREAFFVKPPAETKPKPPVTKPPATHEPAVRPPANTTERTENTQVRVQPVAYAPLALRYSILQEKGNRFEEVDADTQF